MAVSSPFSLDLANLRSLLRGGSLDLRQLIADVKRRITDYNDPALFICRLSEEQIDRQVSEVDARGRAGIELPLYGIPFAVKDNIDVAGTPTTVGCPAFAYLPRKTATVVQKLCEMGGILVGKTNLDQFATGLVGTRSPLGIPRNPFQPEMIPGGSSSGSAVAVSAGLVSFALGTDTAGSGRVPAAFNNIVGVKPSCGRLSTSGVFPACRSLDCVSIFALTCSDAARVMEICAGFDPGDPFSRAALPANEGPTDPEQLRFGVPRSDQLNFFGDAQTPDLYQEAIDKLGGLGARAVEIDFAPLAQVAQLLYQGPWIAERFLAVRDFLANSPHEVLEVTRTIIQKGRDISAADAFAAMHELQSLKTRSLQIWESVDCLLLPTAPTIYRISEVAADPIGLNLNLGYYTNFMNLLDLCGIAVPAGFRSDGLPFGVSLVALAGSEGWLIRQADHLHRAMDLPMGATGQPLPSTDWPVETTRRKVRLAVMGAHLSGLPLNGQLTDRRATFLKTCRTAPHYRFYALPGTTPPKPGMVRVANGEGRAIEVEVWEMDHTAFGSFVAAIPPPLGIGTVILDDGSEVKGFLCESIAVQDARDISQFGGWRWYLASGDK
jgi:allophanate hydrolase